MATKKITLNGLRSIVKQIIKEEITDNRLRINLDFSEPGGGMTTGDDGIKNLKKFKEIYKSLLNNIPVQFSMSYFTSGAHLGSGMLKPFSSSSKEKTNKVELVEYDVYFAHLSDSRNFKGFTTINDFMKDLYRMGQNNAQAFLDNNPSQDNAQSFSDNERF